MKIAKIFFLIFFLFLFVVSTFINIYLIKTHNIQSIEAFNLDGIYLDLSSLNETNSKKIKNFINSNNIAAFNKMVNNSEKPVEQFYAFCGILNYDTEGSIKYLESLLVNDKKVKIYLNSSNIREGYPLGFAYLKLLKDNTKLIKIKSPKSFFGNIETLLINAYKSKISENINEYKNELLGLISDKNPELMGKVISNLYKGESIDELTLNDKIEISYILSDIPLSDRKDVIIEFLKEDNDELLKNTLLVINENDSVDIAKHIIRITNRKTSPVIISLCIRKYGLLLKNKSLKNVKAVMRNYNNKDVLMASLEQIKKYGDFSEYEFLKMYLANKFSREINLLALEAIVTTAYKTNPDDVMNTMSFILRNGKVDLAYYAINFLIEKNLNQNTGLALYRLKKRENKEMEKLAIKFIDFFNLQSGASLLRELYKSDDNEISNEALNLMDKLNIPLTVEES